MKEYDIGGDVLLIDEDGFYSYIPEHCPECHCFQEVNYKDFSCKSIQVCGQCKHEMYLKF